MRLRVPSIPLILLGYTMDKKPVLGGAFEMADTCGFSLSDSLDQADKLGQVISLPHYFAAAIEHGWDDRQAFGKIREALADVGRHAEFERVRDGCVALFMRAAQGMVEAGASDIARKMREDLEAYETVHK